MVCFVASRSPLKVKIPIATEHTVIELENEKMYIIKFIQNEGYTGFLPLNCFIFFLDLLYCTCKNIPSFTYYFKQ